MATAPKYFQKPEKVVTHTISSSPSMQIAGNSRKLSKSGPAPLIQNTGCASCKKRK